MSSQPPTKTPSSSSNVKAFTTGKHNAAAAPNLPHEATTLDDVIREATQTRRLLQEHIQHSIEERHAAKLRDEAMMSILKDLVARVP